MLRPTKGLNRLFSRLQGEVSAETLEAYRRAGAVVYDLLGQVDLRRMECQAEELDPWNTPSDTQALMLCAWNAYVLQHLGDQILQADYDGDSATVDFVPPATAAQILSFYLPVEAWISLALQAQSTPGYQLTSVDLPAALPNWSQWTPRSAAHVRRMLQAVQSLSEHTHHILSLFPQEDSLTDPAQKSQGYLIRQQLASAVSKARYAESLFGGNATPDVVARVQPYIEAAIEGFYLTGQMLAMPQLAAAAPALKSSLITSAQFPSAFMTGPLEDVAPPPAPDLPPVDESELMAQALAQSSAWVPPQVAFDPWMLTDPETLDYWKADPKARAAINEMWANDPDPYKTIAIHERLQAGLKSGQFSYAVNADGERVGCFFCCPWGPIYVSNVEITIARTSLQPGDTFVYDVTAEGVNLGESFRRRILVTNFSSTTTTEYGDPNAPPDH